MAHYHPDFDLPWCHTLLSNPHVTHLQPFSEDIKDAETTNSFFNHTLYTPHAIRSHLSFRRPCSEPDSVDGEESCYLISTGDGVDGKLPGRAHGGFSALVLDQLTGYCSYYFAAANPKQPPATAMLTMEYKKPVSTPCVVFARAWVTGSSGRKIWVRGVIEDGEGRVLASGKALCITVRASKM